MILIHNTVCYISYSIKYDIIQTQTQTQTHTSDNQKNKYFIFIYIDDN